MIRYLILGLLNADIAHHGYAFMKEYRDGCGVEISIGNVYREIRDLLGRGWIRASTNAPGADPRRMPYEITAAGRAALNAWLTDAAAAIVVGRQDELSLRVFLVTRTGRSVPPAVLDRWQEALALRLQILRQRGETIVARRMKSGDRNIGTLSLLVAWRLRHACADIDFVTELRGLQQGETRLSPNVSERRRGKRCRVRNTGPVGAAVVSGKV